MLSFPPAVKNCEFPTYSSHFTTVEQRGFAENTPQPVSNPRSAV